MEKKSHFPAEFQLKSGRTLDRVGKNGFKAKMNFTESLGSKTPSLSPDLCSKSAFTDTEKAVSGTDESRRKSSGYISLQCNPSPVRVSSSAGKVYTSKPLLLKSLEQNGRGKLAEKTTGLQWSET